MLRMERLHEESAARQAAVNDAVSQHISSLCGSVVRIAQGQVGTVRPDDAEAKHEDVGAAVVARKELPAVPVLRAEGGGTARAARDGLPATMNHPKVTLTMRVTFDFTKFFQTVQK